MLEQTNEAEKTDTLSAEEKVGAVNSNTAEFTDGTEKDDVKEEKEEVFTQEQLDKIVKDRLSRQERKIRDEYEEKYNQLETVLNAGLGTKDIPEATQKLTKFYKEQGVDIPETRLTARQEEILATAEADDIIADGYDELVRQTDRLSRKGADNMSAKERIVFSKLAEERQKQENLKELAKIGVGKEILEDREFKEFTSKLNPTLSAKEKYEMYEKLKPKKEIETMGSMKGNYSKDTGVKEFYTVEEAKKFTKADFDKNPKLMEAVEKSMAKWGK